MEKFSPKLFSHHLVIQILFLIYTVFSNLVDSKKKRKSRNNQQTICFCCNSLTNACVIFDLSTLSLEFCINSSVVLSPVQHFIFRSHDIFFLPSPPFSYITELRNITSYPPYSFLNSHLTSEL